MAQYFTDFSGYTKDVFPSDWTDRWVAFTTAEVRTSRYAGASGDAVLYLLPAASSRCAFSWDVVDGDADRADCEVFSRFRWGGGTAWMTALVRGSGTATSETGYRLGSNNAASQTAARYVNGAFATIANHGVALSTGVWWSSRVRVEGTSMKLKAWPDPDPEPAEWQTEVTDSNISAAGFVGLFQFGGAAVDFDVFGVGTGGDAAPTAPAAGVTGPLLRTPSGYLRTASGILRPA